MRKTVVYFFDNTRGHVDASQRLTISSPQSRVDNTDGLFQSGEDMKMNIGTLNNGNGRLFSGRDMALSTEKYIAPEHGLVRSNLCPPYSKKSHRPAWHRDAASYAPDALQAEGYVKNM